MSAAADPAPHKMTVNDLAPNLRGYFEKAVAAVRLMNNDYAIQLFQTILKEVPEFLEGRQLCRKAAIQKKQAAGKKLLDIKTTGLAAMKLQAKAKKDPAGTLPEIEALLADDPFSVQANQLLFEVSDALNLPDTASFALETIRQGHPENSKVGHQLAAYYLLHDHPDKASRIYEGILKVDPTDGEARKGFTNASARLSTKQQKWDKEESGVRSLMKDKGQAKRLELEAKQGMTEEQTQELLDEYMAEYAQDQNNVNTVRKIADLLERLGRFDESYQYYHYAWTISNGDPSLEVKVLKLHDKLHEIHIKQLEDWITENPDHPDADVQRQEVDRLKTEREERLVAVAKERVDKNPTDPQLRFELGAHLFAAGHPTEAIPELQRAKSNPHIRTKAMLILAKCYDAKNMIDLAARTLKEGVSELHVMDGTKKEMLYTLGHLLRRGKHEAEAVDCWKQIYEMDYGYLDVAKLVEESYGG